MSIAERIAKYTMRHTNGCLIWFGYREDGYARTRWHRKNVYVTRLLLEERDGPLPDGCCALHKCDNPSCVEIDHLYSGTHKDNAHDRDSRGRARTQPPGQWNGVVRLTRDKVEEIRRRHAAGESNAALSIATGLQHQHISKITLLQQHNYDRIAA